MMNEIMKDHVQATRIQHRKDVYLSGKVRGHPVPHKSEERVGLYSPKDLIQHNRKYFSLCGTQEISEMRHKKEGKGHRELTAPPWPLGI